MTIRGFAPYDLEELALDALRYRTEGTLPDDNIINFRHGGDFHRGSRKENFVRDVERFAGYDMLMNANVKLPCERKHTVARDSRQN